MLIYPMIIDFHFMYKNKKHSLYYLFRAGVTITTSEAEELA